MKNLLIISMALFFVTSCSPLKHYRKVVTDTHRDNTERALLSKAWHDEFPSYKDSTIVSKEMDSSDYNRFIENENILLQQVIDNQILIDSLMQFSRIDSQGRVVLPAPKCIPSAGDSARFVQNYLRKRMPPPVNNNTKTETPIKNDSKYAELEKALSDCRNEKDKAVSEKEAAEEKSKGTNAKTGWVIGGGLLFGLIMLIVGLLMRKKALI